MASVNEDIEGRVFNFSAGPCCLPYEVLQIAKNDCLNYKSSGMSVMEMSHRSKEYTKIHQDTINGISEIFSLPSNYKVLLMQGGATLQFACVPMNLLSANDTAAYAITGSWGQKAFVESQKYCNSYKVCDTKSTNYNCIPDENKWNIKDESIYLHYCSNETIQGVEFKKTPQLNKPLVCDMSSNFCSKPIDDLEKHVVIYAGVQKNLGPAGVTVVLVRNDVIGKEMNVCPTMCSYKIAVDNNSIYNTPPCFSIYMVGLMLQYIKEKGGLQYWQEYNEKKANLIYDIIDNSDNYYTGHAEKSCRSTMNIPFKIGGGNEKLEKKFLEEGKKKKLYSLEGHRSVGGCRASIYNGMPYKGVDTLATFMKEFMEENPVE